MAQTIAKEAAKHKRCHFHGSAEHPGTHILRINCSLCDDYQVVYTCEQCTKTIRTYEGKPEITVRCGKCTRAIEVQKHWTILGEA